MDRITTNTLTKPLTFDSFNIDCIYNKEESMQAKKYVEVAMNSINTAVNGAESDIRDVAHFIKDIMVDDGIIQLFGIEHDLEFGMELGFRAGGLVQYHQMSIKDLAFRGHIPAEEAQDPNFYDREDLAQKLWDMYETDPRDALVIYAVENVYNVTLALAKLAKEKNHKVIVVSSEATIVQTEYAENAKELLALADKRLDLKIAYPDLVMDVKGTQVCQIANLIGNMFAQSLTMEIYTALIEGSHEAGVLWSANIVGADEHNDSICLKFDGRYNS